MSLDPHACRRIADGRYRCAVGTCSFIGTLRDAIRHVVEHQFRYVG